MSFLTPQPGISLIAEFTQLKRCIRCFSKTEDLFSVYRHGICRSIIKAANGAITNLSNRTKTLRHDRATVVISFLIAFAVEAASLVAMFSTMGHAGPDGRFALIGWLSTLMNF